MCIRDSHEGRPNISDALTNGELAMIINTPHGKQSAHDDSYIRKAAIKMRIPYMTNIAAAKASLEGIMAVSYTHLQIDNLLVGDYILTEIKTPADHDSLNKEYTVTIKSNEVTTKTIVNELIPVGKLIINKKLEGHLDDLSGIEFKITAKEDIKDIITGTVLYRAGMPIGQKDVYKRQVLVLVP